MYGRPLVDIVAPGGRAIHPAVYPNPYYLWPMYKDCPHWWFGTHTYWPTQNQKGNGWPDCDPGGGGGNATSWAAPIAAGSAALLLDFFVQSPDMPWPSYLDVGHLFSNMLLMGDGSLDGEYYGPYAEGGGQIASTPIDDVTGVGRLRMRLFDEEGMDAPWDWGFTYWVEDHGELFVLPINYDEVDEENDPVPSTVDWFRAALWFHEPNLMKDQFDDPIPTSSVRLLARADDGAPTYACSSLVPQSQRLWLGNVVGGEAWSLRVQGLSIPASVDEDYFYNQQKRGMYLSYYWEDRARDDPDGPSSGDDIY